MTRTTLRSLVALAILASAMGAASAHDWSAVGMRGTVLSLVGDQWSEIEHGAVLNGYTALRTLQSGRLELAGDGATIRVGPNTALELLTDPRNATTVIRQYSGSVTLDAGASAEGSLRLETESLTVVPHGGSVTIVVSSATSEVTVAAGGVAAVTSTATGEAVTVAAGAVVASAGPGGGLEIAAGAAGTGDDGGVGPPAHAGDGNGDPGSPGNSNPDSPKPGNPNPGNSNPGNPDPGNSNPGSNNPGSDTPGRIRNGNGGGA